MKEPSCGVGAKFASERARFDRYNAEIRIRTFGNQLAARIVDPKLGSGRVPSIPGRWRATPSQDAQGGCRHNRASIHVLSSHHAFGMAAGHRKSLRVQSPPRRIVSPNFRQDSSALRARAIIAAALAF
jgi:hypothetical protein